LEVGTIPKRYRLQLDYDGLPREEVEADAKRLVEKYPQLGGRYRIETRDAYGAEATDKPRFHVIFPLSGLPFNEAVKIARDSRCDKDWLDYCLMYRGFGLRTGNLTRAKPRMPRPRRTPPQTTIPRTQAKRPEAEQITSPVILIVTPENETEAKRIIGVCQHIDDDTWTYKKTTTLAGALNGQTTQILIGCTDAAQAHRRAAFLKKLNIKFKHRIRDKQIKIASRLS